MNANTIKKDEYDNSDNETNASCSEIDEAEIKSDNVLAYDNEIGDSHFEIKHQNMIEKEIKRLCLKEPVVKGSGKMMTWVWNFYKKEDDLWKCLFCYEKVNINISTSPLINHIRKVHKEEFSIILKYAPDSKLKARTTTTDENDDSDNETNASCIENDKAETEVDNILRSENDNEVEGSDSEFEYQNMLEMEIKRLCLKDPAVKGKGKNIKRSWVWNFYKGKNKKYKCLFCHNKIKVQINQGSGNLTKHIRRCHAKEYSIILKFISTINETKRKTDILTKSFISIYFDKMEDNIFKCKYCEETFHQSSDEIHLFGHIKDEHPDEIVGWEPLNESDLDNEEYTVIVTSEKD